MMRKPIIKAYLFDWGDTLMVDFPGVSGKMCEWNVVEAMRGAEETLEHLSKHASIYIATGASESTADEIKSAFNRVGLDKYIKGYFCKANTGFVKGTPQFLAAILSELKIPKDNVAMVGDSFKKDILPASAAGIRSFWLSSSTERETPASCECISNLLELSI
jgi:putative hydrolase of the HAD superfamily